MNNLNKLIRDYTIKHRSKLKKVCEPLSIYLNIQHYTYFSIQENGDFSIISNYPEQLEYFFSENLHLNNPTLISPRLLRTGCTLIDSTECDDWNELMEEKFKIRKLFMMLEKKGNSIKGYIFTNPQLGLNNLSYYIENIELLNKFNTYFLREMDPVIKKMDNDQFNLRTEKGLAFDIAGQEIPLHSNNENTKAFLNSIYPLTQREQECLELFQQGYSAQSTAAHLGLSRRTVEHHFENIKSKLNCFSKWDLLNV